MDTYSYTDSAYYTIGSMPCTKVCCITSTIEPIGSEWVGQSTTLFIV